MAEFRLNIANLAEGVHQFSFKAIPGNIGLDDSFNGMVEVEATLEKMAHQFFLKAKAHVERLCECDRCLEQFPLDLRREYSVVYLHEGEISIFDEEAEEIQFLPYDANYIDLDEDIRQYIMLAIPVKLLCKEDCLGICPICGANRNETKCNCEIQEVDPRWDKLRERTFN